MSAYDLVLTHTDSYREDPERPHRPSFSPQYDHLPHVSHPHAFGEPCAGRCTELPPLRGSLAEWDTARDRPEILTSRPRRFYPSLGEEKEA